MNCVEELSSVRWWQWTHWMTWKKEVSILAMSKSKTSSIPSARVPQGLPQVLEAAMVKPHSSETSWLFFPLDNEVKICPVLMSFPFSPNKYPLPTSPRSHNVSPCQVSYPCNTPSDKRKHAYISSQNMLYQQMSHRYSANPLKNMLNQHFPQQTQNMLMWTDTRTHVCVHVHAHVIQTSQN